MNAAITERTTDTAQGWVLYDGECSFCVGVVAWFAPILQRHHFILAPLQTAWAQRRIGLNPDEPPAEMKLLAADGRIYGGADAWMEIARTIWWAWPLFAVAQIPGVMFSFRAGYRWIAANRYCLGGACSTKRIRRHRTRAFFEVP